MFCSGLNGELTPPRDRRGTAGSPPSRARMHPLRSGELGEMGAPGGGLASVRSRLVAGVRGTCFGRGRPAGGTGPTRAPIQEDRFEPRASGGVCPCPSGSAAATPSMHTLGPTWVDKASLCSVLRTSASSVPVPGAYGRARCNNAVAVGDLDAGVPLLAAPNSPFSSLGPGTSALEAGTPGSQGGPLLRSSRQSSGPLTPSGRLSPLLERPLTPPPPPHPCLRLWRTVAVSTRCLCARVGVVCSHIMRCSWQCVAICALVAAVCVAVLLICDRQPSPCAHPSRESLATARDIYSGVAGRVSYNETVARANAMLAAASYCPQAVIQRWRCAACAPAVGLRNVTFFASMITDSAGFVGWHLDANGPQAVVVFRGTAANRNWLADAIFGHHLQREWGAGSVHLGFLAVYQSVQGRVRELLRGMRADALRAGAIVPAQLRVRIVGHSLGGALATLTAADLISSDLFRVDELWTFGSPRVGDAKFAAWLHAETLSRPGMAHWRVTHSHDPVIHVPLRSMGFQHIPTEVWYPDKTPPRNCQRAYLVCQDSPVEEDQECAERVWLAMCLHRSGDHLNYVGVRYDHRVSCAEPPPPHYHTLPLLR